MILVQGEDVVFACGSVLIFVCFHFVKNDAAVLRFGTPVSLSEITINLGKFAGPGPERCAAWCDSKLGGRYVATVLASVLLADKSGFHDERHKYEEHDDTDQ